MQSKTAFVEKYLLDRVCSGEYSAGSKIPSQHKLMHLCKCSRITVQRALKKMAHDGYLRTERGRGTFVMSGSRTAQLREIIMVVENFPHLHPYDDILPGSLPVRWIDAQYAMSNCERFFVPGQAVIWYAAKEGYIMLMQYLRSRGIAQLLINRTYDNLDYVTLDAVASISEGLEWLLKKCGREIAFITYNPDYNRPYLAERVIAFYEACVASGAELAPERIFRRDFSDYESAFADLGQALFADVKKRPRGICVLHSDLVQHTVKCAGKYGLEFGKDYFILAFDVEKIYKNHPGLAMMVQPKHRFRSGVAQWLNYRMSPENTAPFAYRIKTELHING